MILNLVRVIRHYSGLMVNLIFHLHGKSLEDEVKIFKKIDKAVKHLKRLLNDALGNENTESVWTNSENNKE